MTKYLRKNPEEIKVWLASTKHRTKKLDRYQQEIVEEWNTITKKLHANTIVLDMPSLVTTQYKNSMGIFIADLVLRILSWIAQDESDRIRKW